MCILTYSDLLTFNFAMRSISLSMTLDHHYLLQRQKQSVYAYTKVSAYSKH
jgi:hypothetical protein